MDKQSTHSYEYKSSIRTNNSSNKEASSIIDNLQALNISIQKREKELAKAQGSAEEMERKRMALINAETSSVNSIPGESESGGPALGNNQQFISSSYEEIKEVTEPPSQPSQFSRNTCQ